MKRITGGLLSVCTVAAWETNTLPVHLTVRVRRAKGGCCCWCPWWVKSQTVAKYYFRDVRRDPIFGSITSNKATLNLEALHHYQQKDPRNSMVEFILNCRYNERLLAAARLEELLGALLQMGNDGECLILLEDGKIIVKDLYSVQNDIDYTVYTDLAWPMVKVGQRENWEVNSDVSEVDSLDIIDPDNLDFDDSGSNSDVSMEIVNNRSDTEDDEIDVCKVDEEKKKTVVGVDVSDAYICVEDAVKKNEIIYNMSTETCERENDANTMIDIEDRSTCSDRENENNFQKSTEKCEEGQDLQLKELHFSENTRTKYSVDEDDLIRGDLGNGNFCDWKKEFENLCNKEQNTRDFQHKESHLCDITSTQYSVDEDDLISGDLGNGNFCDWNKDKIKMVNQQIRMHRVSDNSLENQPEHQEDSEMRVSVAKATCNVILFILLSSSAIILTGVILAIIFNIYP